MGFAQVLLAEDDQVNARLAYEVLTRMHCNVTVVCDGAAALNEALQRAFDVILMDVRMPVMDGLAATRSIAAFESSRGRRHTPVVAVTAAAMRDEQQACVDAGVDAILIKPYAVRDLEHVVRQWTLQRDGTRSR
jgi:CheY-like chemotaxis protein